MNFFIPNVIKINRRYLVFPLDMILVALSFHLAETFRFNSLSPENWGTMFPGYWEYTISILLILLSKGFVFSILGLYRGIWAFASTHDLILIFKATLISSLTAISALMLYNRLEYIPRSVLLLDGIFLFLLLCFRSFSWRIFRDIIFSRSIQNGKNTIIIGANLTTNRLITDLKTQNSLGLKPIAILEDDAKKIGGSIQGIPIVGKVPLLDEYLTRLNVEAVIITADIPGNEMRQIYRTCREKRLQCKTLPSSGDIFAIHDIGAALRDIKLDDLLGREEVKLETEGILKELKNKNILITGAGGSIGSEVVRQLLHFEPAMMLLLDNAETPLYEIDYEIRNSTLEGKQKPKLLSIIGDVRNKNQITEILFSYDIHTLFHCAAYKHVPMMELNPSEAIENNVLGTCNVANAARDAGIERFVMISTDKAVNPVNIMGASKRLAELYIQNLSSVCDTKFITVRFGNVLGSNGSVIPLFKKQIENGGPITVTHPDIIRYFMTIQEAAGLVIQAGIMGRGGEIFILDMGDPVKIIDLAEDMIRFAGLRPGIDIKIKCIGLRPGEKLFEELLLEGEGTQKTHHKKIHVAQSRNINLVALTEQILDLARIAKKNDRNLIDSAISKILPEYKPAISKNGPQSQEEKNLPTSNKEITDSTPPSPME